MKKISFAAALILLAGYLLTASANQQHAVYLPLINSKKLGENNAKKRFI